MGNGHGVTELISACNYEATANGVGIYSFTHHLLTELKFLLSTKGRFTAAELWGHIYHRMQSHIPRGLKNERYPAPVHYFITQDPHFPRSIMLSQLALPPLRTEHNFCEEVSSGQNCTSTKRPPLESHDDGRLKRLRVTSNVQPTLEHPDSQYPTDNVTVQPESRAMLFAVRLEEATSTNDLNLDAFIEWCRSIPASVHEIKVEAQFESDSTIILVKTPLPLWVCLKDHPAVMTIGPVRSSNILAAGVNPSIQEVEELGTSWAGSLSKQNKDTLSGAFDGPIWDTDMSTDVDSLVTREYSPEPEFSSSEIVSLDRFRDLSSILTFRKTPSAFALSPGTSVMGSSIRDHPLYKYALTRPDGLFHCPWEGQSSCDHKPDRLKCNYE